MTVDTSKSQPTGLSGLFLGELYPFNVSSSLDQESSPTRLRVLVSQKVREGDYWGSIDLLTQLINHYPDQAMDYNNRGLIYFYLGQWDQSIDDLNQAITLNPRLDSAYNNRGNCYVKKGFFNEAIEDYATALDFNPANLKALINQGITYREMGCYELALENFDLALILSQKMQGRLYAERGHTYHLRGDWNCAIADYYRALDHLIQAPSFRSLYYQVQDWLDELTTPMTA